MGKTCTLVWLASVQSSLAQGTSTLFVSRRARCVAVCSQLASSAPRSGASPTRVTLRNAAFARRIRRCVACTRRCSFRQAKISEWVVVEWVAAALLTTRPLLSECLPALTAVPAALTKQAKRQSKGLHTRASSHCNLLLWRATPLWQLAAVVQ